MPLQDWLSALSSLPMLSLNMGKRATDKGLKTLWLQIAVSLISALIIGIVSSTATMYVVLGDLETDVKVNAAHINDIKDNFNGHMNRLHRRHNAN